LVRDPEVGRELLVGAVERRIRNVVPVEDAGSGAVDDPGGTVGMPRLEDADALERRGGKRCGGGHGSSLLMVVLPPPRAGVAGGGVGGGGAHVWWRAPRRGGGGGAGVGARAAGALKSAPIRPFGPTSPASGGSESARQLEHHSHSAMSMSLERT